MTVFTCRPIYEDMMTCIYTAWEYALKHGHDQVKLLREPITQLNLFDEYIHVEPDEGIEEKVSRSIRGRISEQVMHLIYYVCNSYEEDALDTIYRFLIRGFKMGACVIEDLSNPVVMRFFEIKRSVGNEIHLFREFARFASVNNQVYICHLEPKNNVISFVAEHFADRMPSEHFMIIDDCRRIAIVHPKDGENYFRILTEEEFQMLAVTDTYTDEYTDMWKTFFKAIAIEPRRNARCQMNHFPKWMRKHATEFLDT